jgi:pimeloyl-ACP methyl ester carboxylesterase
MTLTMGGLGGGATAQPAPDRGPGRLVRISDGRRIYLDCRGHGRPTVIFEGVGGGPSVTDMPSQRFVEKFTRVCVYDRAGFGWSDPAPPGRSFEERVADLHQALRAAHERGPYVLVGSSFGGLLARTYTRLWPKEVVGMVLVDSAEEGHWFPWMTKAGGENRQTLRGYADQARSGAMRHSLEAQLAGPNWFTPQEKRWLIEGESRPEHWEAAVDEVAAFDRTPPDMRFAGAFGTLGARPLVVLSHGTPFGGGTAAEGEPAWAAAQDRLAALSTNKAHVVAAKNSHIIGLENPPLVAEAVRTVVQSVRSGFAIDAEPLLAMASESPVSSSWLSNGPDAAEERGRDAR